MQYSKRPRLMSGNFFSSLFHVAAFFCNLAFIGWITLQNQSRNIHSSLL